MPSPGKIEALAWPSGPGVRVDAGVDGHSEVPMAYDPMIAKLCTWGAHRDQAIQRMHRALDETVLLGVTTNIELHHRVMTHPAFREGRYDTGLLNEEMPAYERKKASDGDAAKIAAA